MVHALSSVLWFNSYTAWVLSRSYSTHCRLNQFNGENSVICVFWNSLVWFWNAIITATYMFWNALVSFFSEPVLYTFWKAPVRVTYSGMPFSAPLTHVFWNALVWFSGEGSGSSVPSSLHPVILIILLLYHCKGQFHMYCHTAHCILSINLRKQTKNKQNNLPTSPKNQENFWCRDKSMVSVYPELNCSFVSNVSMHLAAGILVDLLENQKP